MRRLITVFMSGVALAGGSAARADEAGGKIREVSAKHQQSLAILKGTIELEINMGGQTQNQETAVEFPACVMSDGLFVTVNPESAAAYPQMAMARAQGIQIEIRGKEYRLVYPDGTESAVKVEGVDSEYGLAFVRPDGAAKRPPAPAASAKKPAVGDPFVTLQLMSSGRSEVVAEMLRVDALLEKPSTMFRFSGPAIPVGVPAFDLEGNFLGLTCLYQESRAGGQPVGHQVILPAARLAELAAQMKKAADAPQK